METFNSGGALQVREIHICQKAIQMTAHVSVALARYMLLSLEQRRKIDKRSIGELFYVSCDELQDFWCRR